jgi:predicted RNA methylase
LLGSEVWSGLEVRDAVAGGGALFWAFWALAARAVKRMAPDNSETASALEVMLIDLLLLDR